MARESNPTDPTAAVEPPAVADPPARIDPPVVADPPAYGAPPPLAPPAGRPVPAPPSAPRRTSAPVGWVIAAMLLFWPTGIPALLASHRAAQAFGAGAVDVALHESANARRWSIISVIVGGVLVVVSVLSVIVWAVVVAVAVGDHRNVEFGRGPSFSNEMPFGGPDRSGRQGSAG